MKSETITIFLIGICLIMCAFSQGAIKLFRTIFYWTPGKIRMKNYLNKYFGEESKKKITQSALISVGIAFVIIAIAVQFGIKEF